MRGFFLSVLVCVALCLGLAPDAVQAAPCDGDCCRTALSVPVTAIVAAPGHAVDTVKVIVKAVAKHKPVRTVSIETARKVVHLQPVRKVAWLALRPVALLRR